MIRSQSHDDDLLSQFSALFDGRIDVAAHEALQQRLMTDLACVDTYLHFADLHAELSLRCGPTPMVQPAPRPTGVSSRRPIGWVAWAAAALLAISLSVWVAMTRQQPAIVRQAPANVATLTNVEHAVFAGENVNAINLGDALSQQRIELTSGTAQVMFNSGAVVDLVGPCTFDLIDDNHGRLTRGAMHALVREAAHGFMIDIPGGQRVIDLGTEFGLYVGADRHSELYVYQGRVRLDPSSVGRGVGQVLTVGDARRIDANGTVRAIAMDSDRFPPGVIDNVNIPIDLADATLPQVMSHWRTMHIEAMRVVDGWISGRAGRGDAVDSDAMMIRNDLGIEGSSYRYVEIQIASDPRQNLTELFWSTESESPFSPTRSIAFSVADGRVHTFVIDMSQNENWTGQRIRSLRLDPVKASGAWFRIRRVRLLSHLPYAMARLRAMPVKDNASKTHVYRLMPTGEARIENPATAQPAITPAPASPTATPKENPR